MPMYVPTYEIQNTLLEFDGFTLNCGQTNYYITVSQPVANQITNDLMQNHLQCKILRNTQTQKG